MLINYGIFEAFLLCPCGGRGMFTFYLLSKVIEDISTTHPHPNSIDKIVIT